MLYELVNLGPRLRVLCWEGDQVDQLAMQDYAWILGWDLSISGELQQCLTLAATNRFDLIVADLNVGADPCAIKVVKTIRREMAVNADLPALLLTDRPVPAAARQQATEMGAAVFREKPLMLSDLKHVATSFVKQQYQW